jgi:hypothetical protein
MQLLQHAQVTPDAFDAMQRHGLAVLLLMTITRGRQALEA